jgi:hypothetical protein
LYLILPQVLWATPMSFGAPIIQYEVQMGNQDGLDWKTVAFIEPRHPSPGAAHAAQEVGAAMALALL